MGEDAKIAIVAHDAGGAEILASYIDQNKGQYNLALEGPAKNIFNKKFGAIQTMSLDQAIDESSLCICGTGWQSNFEWDALGIARKKNKKSIAFLDHWSNYAERFIRNGLKNFPDEIWVGDKDAKNLAQLIFDEIPISLVPNPYWLEIKKQLFLNAPIKRSSGNTILYVSENISQFAISNYGNVNYFGYTELDAILFFMRHLSLVAPADSRVILRPHPSDAPGKYSNLVRDYERLELSSGGSLIEEILDSDLVVGCESMALIIGLMAGKKVVSSIPLRDVACRLPQTEIIRLSDLVA